MKRAKSDIKIFDGSQGLSVQSSNKESTRARVADKTPGATY